MEAKEHNTKKTPLHSLSERVLSRIETEHIVPRAQWEFVAQNMAFWVFAVVSAVIGAAAVSALIFVETHSGWEYYEATHDNFLTHFVTYLPVIWLILLAIMLILGYILTKKTKHGYRYPLMGIILVSVGASFLGGFLIDQYGGSFFVEETLGQYVPFHEPILKRQTNLWQQPQDGRLIGRLQTPDSASDTIVFQDVTGGTWSLDNTELQAPDRNILLSGKDVRLVGVADASDTSLFHVCHVFPGLKDRPVSIPELLEYRQNFVNELFNDTDTASSNTPLMYERNVGWVRSNWCDQVMTQERSDHY